LRASRSFDPGQIIVEYTGEIITQEESDRRLDEVYKDNTVCRVIPILRTIPDM
jgi:histone-lysine N-methyltransferase ASH1L